MLSLKLSFKSENMFTRGIVDSGSTGTFMPFSIVQLIGLLDGNNTSLIPSKSRSVSGTFESYEAILPSIKIIHKKTLFDEFRNPIVKILRKNAGIDFIILGRDLIFNRYDVTFSDKRRKLILSKHKKINGVWKWNIPIKLILDKLFNLETFVITAQLEIWLLH